MNELKTAFLLNKSDIVLAELERSRASLAEKISEKKDLMQEKYYAYSFVEKMQINESIEDINDDISCLKYTIERLENDFKPIETSETTALKSDIFALRFKISEGEIFYMQNFGISRFQYQYFCCDLKNTSFEEIVSKIKDVFRDEKKILITDKNEFELHFHQNPWLNYDEKYLLKF
jgi:CRISPR/Cas system-associated endoribonuclease Cas2